MGKREKKQGSVIHEMHLYPNKIEALIKDSIWIISWIGGILTLQNASDKKALGGSYFIFSLSLLMEFAPQISKKSYLRSKFFHTLFCGSLLIVMFMAIGLLVGIKGDNLYFNIEFWLSIGAIGYIVLDLIVLWLGREEKEDGKRVDIVNSDRSNKLAAQKFQESLVGGKLGQIREEVKK